MEIEVELAGIEKHAAFDTLFDKDIWICDTGGLSHLTNTLNGATNVGDSGTPSLGHTGTAVKATKTIDVQGQFVNNDGNLGLKGTLTDVNYSPMMNFNLLSLTRLLKNGWNIVSGNETGIKVEKDGNVISSWVYFCMQIHSQD